MSTDPKPPIPKLPDAATSRSFSRFAANVASAVGSSGAFLMAAAIVLLWGLTGPFFHFSDAWQLVINTSTTIVTFLMVFLIQNTQNRDSRAIHLKLDEIIRSHHFARNEMIDIEKLSDAQLEELARFYEQIRREHEQRAARNRRTPQVSPAQDPSR
jgi:low affinity Fe/Cu permease